MQELALIGLRIQRMPSEPGLEFGIPSAYSYMTVRSCVTAWLSYAHLMESCELLSVMAFSNSVQNHYTSSLDEIDIILCKYLNGSSLGW